MGTATRYLIKMYTYYNSMSLFRKTERVCK